MRGFFLSISLFLNYLPEAPYWQYNPFRVYSKNTLILLIFLQKRNTNVKYKPPFTITPVILRLVSEISELVGHVQALSGSASPLLRRENRIRTIHASLAIENNTLTLEQVTAVLSRTHILGQLREIQGVRNAFSAYEQLETCPHFLAKRHSCGPCHTDGWHFVKHLQKEAERLTVELGSELIN